MGNHDGDAPLGPFRPDNFDSCAGEWQDYKREFLIHLDAKGLHTATGRRQVGQLLKHMGKEHILTFDTFTWAPAIVADATHGIEAVDAESCEELNCVFGKFDVHFGVHKFRSIKRQEFLDTKRGTLTIMNFIAELKRKARYCQYGDKEESFICDMVINRVNDAKCSERLMELNDEQLNLANVMRICRQVELTKAHIDNLSKDKGNASAHVNRVQTDRGRWRGRGNRGRWRSGSRGRTSRSSHIDCDRCCNHHPPNECNAYNQYCGSCGEMGHFKKSPRCSMNNGQSPRRGTRPDYGGRGRRNGYGGSYRNNYGGNPRNNYGGSYRNNYGGSYRNNYRPNYGRGQRRPYERQQQVHYADGEGYNESEFGELFEQCNVHDVFTIHTQNNDSDWTVALNIYGKAVKFEIDCEAACNILSMCTVEAIDMSHRLTPSDVIISGVSGTRMKSFGCIVLPCRYKDTVLNLQFEVVTSHKNVNLLGRGDCVSFGLIARVNMTMCEKQACNTILNDYSDVLGDAIGCIPGEYTTKIDPSAAPVIHAPRAVPVPIREQVKKRIGPP